MASSFDLDTVSEQIQLVLLKHRPIVIAVGIYRCVDTSCTWKINVGRTGESRTRYEELRNSISAHQSAMIIEALAVLGAENA